MSCLNDKSNSLACPCDAFTHPQPLDIPAGLSSIPRQIATFSEFRKAMLTEIRNHYPLKDWSAREQDDLGVMLLEMWAYICDNLSFYDEVIAHESYLRTARLRPSLRKLIALLGYLPRPAVAATVELAALADGRKPVLLPAGTAFRSGGFDGEPPQIFELDSDTRIHPFTNKWQIQWVYSRFVDAGSPSTLMVKAEGEIKKDAVLLLEYANQDAYSQAIEIKEASTFTGDDGKNYTQLDLKAPARLHSRLWVSRMQLFAPSQTANLWTLNQASSSVQTTGDVVLVLDALYTTFQKGGGLIVAVEEDFFFGRIKNVDKVPRNPNPATSITINGNTFNLPETSMYVTQLTLDNAADGGTLKDALTGSRIGSGRRRIRRVTAPPASDIRVHYGMRFTGAVVTLPEKLLKPSDPLAFTKEIETPLGDHDPRAFLLQDKNENGAWIGGELTLSKPGIQPSDLDEWEDALYAPVHAFGNVVAASRGESVSNEVLGSGDASVASQSFKLKKKPLTYLLSPTADNDQGVINTLEVYVDGIQWAEAANFYLTGPQDQVFIVRQDDEGESYVIFGDGERGQRLPTGTSNVVANYRFGAGAASPPEGSISQIAKPVTGLQAVKNPVAASGGADAEPADEMRDNAPQSALILGRAVSIKDMEAVALSIPGVRVVQAEWRWHGEQQRPVVHLWYVGESGLEETISERLRNVSDPSTPFQVDQAKARKVRLHLDLVYDARYAQEPLLEELQAQLLDEEQGILLPERLGIGKPLFRSRIFEALLAVEGTHYVRQILWNRRLFSDFARKPKAGFYFDFETYTPGITLTEDAT